MGSMELAVVEKATTIRTVYVTFLDGKKSIFCFLFPYAYADVSMKKKVYLTEK